MKRWPFSGFFVCPAAVIVMSAKFSLKDFPPHQITLQHGDTLPLHLAERGTHLGNGLWLRELRRLDEKGHQTSILSTDYRFVNPARRALDAVVTHLCEELNATETHYPGTKLRLKYIPLRSSTFLLDQDV